MDNMHLRKTVLIITACAAATALLICGLPLIQTSADGDPHTDFTKVYTELFDIAYAWLGVEEPRMVLETDGFDGDHSGFQEYLESCAREKSMQFFCGTHEEIRGLGFYEYFEDGDWYRFESDQGMRVYIDEKPIDSDRYSVTMYISLCMGATMKVGANVDIDDLSYTLTRRSLG